jgi:hypothetical protein
MSYMIKSCIELFKTGIWDSSDRAYSHGGEAMKASTNIQLEISVDQENGTGIDHILTVN